MIKASTIIIATAAGFAAAGPAPFVETFESGANNWRDITGVLDATWNATGGVENSGYISTTYNFANNLIDDTPSLIRGHASYPASGGAFVGDWTDGIDQFSLSVRHDGPAPATLFVRFAGAGNFPGAVAVAFVPIFAGQWTDISFDIDAASPNFVTFEGTDFNSVFSSVGNIQIGLYVDESYAGLDQNVTLDIDNIAIVPTPAAAVLLAGGGLIATRRRRA